MVNNENFPDRLRIIIEFYNLSASSFAEKVNVQRSSISHLLSGRNKPSLDFVMKVLKAFKEVELYWFINGVGSFPKKNPIKEKIEAPNLFSKEKKKYIIENETPKKIEVPIDMISKNTSQIDKIVIFYKDGTFKQYKELD